MAVGQERGDVDGVAETTKSERDLDSDSVDDGSGEEA